MRMQQHWTNLPKQLNQHIYLIGFMGSGKTYAGRRLSGYLQVPFADLDDLIVHNAGLSIPMIFESLGEPYFRELESNVLRQTAHLPPSIISCGGGAPCYFDNLAWMKANGITIYLQTDPNLLAFRLRREQQGRPLIQNLDEGELIEFIQRRLEEREFYYLQADIIYRQYQADQQVAEDLAHQLQQVTGS